MSVVVNLRTGRALAVCCRRLIAHHERALAEQREAVTVRVTMREPEQLTLPLDTNRTEADNAGQG